MYLEEQVKSLMNQVYKDFRIIIKDDGSNDNSKALINKIAAQNKQVVVVNDHQGNLGVSKCFEVLMRHVTSDYFMFCDQDDIWMPHKIDNTMAKMKEMEALYPGNAILVCTDSTCVDNSGNVTAKSFFSSQKFKDVVGDEVKMAALNIVQGNTCLMNKKCLDFIKSIPEIIVYDQWIGILIAHYGHVAYLHEPTLFYRQHMSNVVGANDVTKRYFIKKVMRSKYQCKIYMSIFKNLPFKLNFPKWLFYKVYFNLKRL